MNKCKLFLYTIHTIIKVRFVIYIHMYCTVYSVQYSNFALWKMFKIYEKIAFALWSWADPVDFEVLGITILDLKDWFYLLGSHSISNLKGPWHEIFDLRFFHKSTLGGLKIRWSNSFWAKIWILIQKSATTLAQRMLTVRWVRPSGLLAFAESDSADC